MVAKAMSMDEFLDHSGSDSGSTSVLKWKEDGSIDVLIHPRAPFYAVWSHSWFHLGKDRETGEPKIFFSRWNSYEDEEILKKSRFRGDDGEYEVQYPWHTKPVSYHGARRIPPVLDPFALLLEWVREQIDGTETIGWLDVIFDIDTDSGDDNATVIHAGGFCGLFSAKDMDKEEETAMKKAGIRRSEAFKEEGKARMQYVMTVVPYKKPSEGPTVAIEAEALGKKFKQMIKDMRDDGRDPRTNPVVFRWKYDEGASFSDKYSVAVRTNDTITEDHTAALAKEWPQEKVDRVISLGNLVALRESFERWWKHKVIPPWDAIFAPAMAAYKGKPEAQAPSDSDEKDGEDSDDEEDDAPASVRSKDEPAPEGTEDDNEEEVYACSNPACGKPMKGTDMVCPHCGAVYDEEGNFTLPKKEEAKPKSRAAAAAGTRAPKRGSKS